MSSISSKFNAITGVIEYSQSEDDFDVDDETDLDMYLNNIFSHPQGIKVAGSAAEMGMRKIINFRGLQEFQQAFSCLHPDEQCIHYFFGCACENANLPVAQYLLAMGADVNGDGESADDRIISWMFGRYDFMRRKPNFQEFKERHYNVLRFLLTFPEFDPLGETNYGDAWGCLFDYQYPVDILEGFLRKGANPNQFDDGFDERPLCVAAVLNNFEYVDLLLRYGAVSTLRDGEGRLPSDCTENEEILGRLRSSVPYMQLLYCFHVAGIHIDADSAADIIGYFPDFHSEDE